MPSTTGIDISVAGIGLATGSHNVVVANTIDGRGTRVGPSHPYAAGADDGIILDGESYAYVADNSISHVWDAGVEWLELLESSSIINNRMDDIGVAAVGAYALYYPGAENSTISFNTATNASTLLEVDEWSTLGDGQTVVKFTNNRIEGNALVSQSAPDATRPDSFFPGAYFVIFEQPAIVPLLPSSLANNVFIGNDFGTKGEPVFVLNQDYVIPKGQVLDGGGNKCVRPHLASENPLSCD